MKKSVGYWNFGANNKFQAICKYGVQVRQTQKPNRFKRFWAWLASIYWIDEIKET